MPTLVRDEGFTIEHVRFRSGPYWLEGNLTYHADEAPLGSAVVAGPHPLLGGDMANNVVAGLAGGLARRGLVVLRFNYRGVGASEGPSVDVAAHLANFWATSHVDDEADFLLDLLAACEFLRSAAPEAPCALIGYSFGCTLLPFASRSDDVLVVLAPTIGVHDYGAYDGVQNPVLAIASEDDFASDATRLRRWFDCLSAPKRLLQPRLDDHFFRGHEDWLAESTAAFLREHWK